MTCFHASFVVEGNQIAISKSNFVIEVWGSEFILWTFTVIAYCLLLEGMSVTFQDRLSCKETDAIVRSFTDFEVSDIHVYPPSFKMFSLFLLVNFKTNILYHHLTGFPIFGDNC